MVWLVDSVISFVKMLLAHFHQSLHIYRRTETANSSQTKILFFLLKNKNKKRKNNKNLGILKNQNTKLKENNLSVQYDDIGLSCFITGTIRRIFLWPILSRLNLIFFQAKVQTSFEFEFWNRRKRELLFTFYCLSCRIRIFIPFWLGFRLRFDIGWYVIRTFKHILLFYWVSKWFSL